MSIRSVARKQRQLERRVQLARMQERMRRMDNSRYTLSDMMIKMAEKTHRDIEITYLKKNEGGFYGS